MSAPRGCADASAALHRGWRIWGLRDAPPALAGRLRSREETGQRTTLNVVNMPSMMCGMPLLSGRKQVAK